MGKLEDLIFRVFGVPTDWNWRLRHMRCLFWRHGFFLGGFRIAEGRLNGRDGGHFREYDKSLWHYRHPIFFFYFRFVFKLIMQNKINKVVTVKISIN